MLYNVYSVLNRNTKEWSLPMCLPDQSQALRIFYLQIQASEMMQKFPDDFELYELGEFQSDLVEVTEAGDVVNFDQPISVAEVFELGFNFVVSVRDCLKWYDELQKKGEASNV